jgi:hypothetical protein
LILDINWINGKATGWEKYSDSDGKSLTDLSWKNGLETGYQTILDDDGRPVSYTTFKNGKKHGIHRAYSTIRSSGASYVKVEDNYKDGVLDGRPKIYSEASWKWRAATKTACSRWNDKTLDGERIAGGADVSYGMNVEA